ncbi:MAG: indole-3-glycerol phosphate synthase TrpC [Pyrinomonadaceae bacterium]
MTFLDEILALKRSRVEQAKAACDLTELKAKAANIRSKAKHFALSSALKNPDKIHVIAEIKRASPSKGIINDKINVAEVARNYGNGGAAAISVLTEEDRFKGSLEDLKTVRAQASLPILRKDFIFDEFQITEAAAAGADVILLIVAMLDDEDLKRLYDFADALGLDVVVEVHTLEELKRAENLNAKLVGVNNRDLHSFKVSLDVSRRLIKHAPENALTICESGISTKEEILELRELGFSGFLIGETLMRSENVAEELKRLTT